MEVRISAKHQATKIYEITLIDVIEDYFFGCTLLILDSDMIDSFNDFVFHIQAMWNFS